MNVKKTIKKLVALGTGATMVGATIMGAMADLSMYPEPFVVGGVMDTLIVVGSEAKTMDTLGAIDIAASLQALAVTPVASGGTTGGTTVTGDHVKVARGSDMLEINETIGNVRKVLTENDLKALSGGTITAGGKTTKYNQYLRFNFTDLNNVGQNSGTVIFGENRDDEIGDFLFFNGGDYMWEYQLEFAEGLQSDIDTAGTGLEDIEDEAINIFGTDFTIVDTTVATTDTITLKLMGGEVTDTLGEGETKTYTIDGADYEVTAVFISDQANAESVKFSVNGELTKELQEGDTDILSSGMEIGVRAVLTNQREGIAEFYLGANKVELTDTNDTDTTWHTGVEIGGETIDDARLKIKSSHITDADADGNREAGDKVSISSIYYQLKADLAGGGTDIYVPPGHGLREFLDEPEGMLNPTWDIKYEGMTDTEMYPIVFDAKGDRKYELTFTTSEGLEYSIPLAEVYGSKMYFGTKDEAVWFTEFTQTANAYTNYSIRQDDYFIVNDRADEAGATRVLTFDSVDTTNTQIYLTDIAAGTKKITYSGTPTTCGSASGDLVVGGNTYKVYLCGDGTDANWRLQVDLDGDTTLTENDPVNITTMGGVIVDLQTSASSQNKTSGMGIWNASMASSTVSPDNFYVRMTTLKELYDEDGPNNLGIDQEVSLYISRSTDKVDLTLSSNAYVTLYEDNDNSDWSYGIDLYGSYYKYNNPSTTTDANELTIEVPKVQRGPEVFVTAGVVSTQKTTASGDGAVVVNNAAVGVGVLDSDVRLGQGNLIVVGGPCVNTIAQELMGNPENCAEGFEPGKAVIKLYEDQNALLVAGYGWQDTLGASYVLADYEDYELSGTEMEVVVADLDSITVSRVE